MDMQVRFLRRALALCLAAQVALIWGIPVRAAPEESTARAVEWFLKNKASDGALPGFGNGYTVGGTADGVLALAGAGENPGRFGRRSGATPVEYLESHAADDTSSDDVRDGAHLAGKVALAVKVGGKDPHSFGGVNLVALIQQHYDPATGGYRGPFASNPIHPFGQSLAILGLIASEEAVPQKAVDYLFATQQPDGGWEFGPGFGSDVTTTAMVIQALVALSNAFGQDPRTDAAVTRALQFIRQGQNDDGGFSNQKQFAGNFCSGTMPSEVDVTGLAIQAVRSGGQDPAAAPWLSATGINAPGFLKSVQFPDGSFPYQQGPDCKGNGGSTQSAMLGIEQKSFVCLLHLGTCPPKTAVSGAGPGGQADPAADTLPPAAKPPGTVPAQPPVKGTGSDVRKAGGSRRAGSAGPASTRPMKTSSPQPCPAGSCKPSTASPSTTSSASGVEAADAALAAPAPGRSPSSKRGLSGRSISEKGAGRRNFVVVAGLLIIAGLSVSIARQLLRARSSGDR